MTTLRECTARWTSIPPVLRSVQRIGRIVSHALITWTAPGAGQSSTLGLPGTIDVCDLILVGKEISIGLLNLSGYS